MSTNWKPSMSSPTWAQQSRTASPLRPSLNRRIGKAATTLSRLTQRVWRNSNLTEHTKIQVFKACLVITLLFGSESWTPRSRQERRLNRFHMRCIRRILCISWRDKVTNNAVLQRAGIPTMFSLLKQRRMRWLGHVCRMEDGRILKDLLYDELVTGKRPTGRPQLRYKGICKRDLKARAPTPTPGKQPPRTGPPENRK